MTHETSTRDYVDLMLLAAVGVIWVLLLIAVLLMLRSPYDTIMYVHFLWRGVWLAIVMVLLATLAGLRMWLRPRNDGTPRKGRCLRTLDGLLLLGVAALPVMLFYPPNDTGHDPLRQGAQVCRQYPAPNRTSTSSAGPRLHYLLYLPAEYMESRRWPLVVLARRRGHWRQSAFCPREGVPNQIERGKQFPFILLSPQCPGRGWNPETTVALIDHVCRTLPVDPDRVYLTGESMGGHGTWNIASRYPDRFAAIAPVCGGGDERLAARLVNVPIWAFHGAKDNVVPPVLSQTMVDAVTKCGGHAKRTLYPDDGHMIGDFVYADEHLYQWLLGQRRSPPQPRNRVAEPVGH